ncbi:OmpA family protein [Pseudomonas plecoglossicida]|uniref:OmpA family protein n=1 Tax=Pseudomonas plecoglossicida TaxID=70775 RepID=UPI0015E3D8E9|nr:OmpA family protein [Pseudomonas plecoglossicida]MBA1198998.1 OmpA family protein [Pseudomonas plecoglossicida]
MFHACQIQPQNPVCCRRAAGLGGCASAVAPNEQIELTRSAVNRAVSADATQYAPVEMRAAQDKLSAMDRALGEKDLKTVRSLAERKAQARLDVRSAQLKALQNLKAKRTERGTVVTFGDVLFDTGRGELRSGSQRNIQQLAQYLQDNPQRKVLVEGFTDSTGSDALNQQLSERRAAAVGNALRRQSVSADRIVTAGYGKEYPVATNADAQSRQLNRRVEVIISRDAQAVAPRY